MNGSNQQKGNAIVFALLLVVAGAVAVMIGYKVVSHPWFKFLMSPGAASAIVEEVEALEARNEELKERIEELDEKLGERMEDDDREQDAGRRLFFRN